MTQMTQDEIITNTKTVMQGLEALKNEHNSILHGIDGAAGSQPSSLQSGENAVEEKSGLVQKSLEMIELGLGEAQVCTLILFHVVFSYSNHLYSGDDGSGVAFTNGRGREAKVENASS
jgi:kinesin light chain